MKKIFIALLLITSLALLGAKTASADAQETIEDSLGVPASDIILIISILGCIVLTAFDARIALMFATLLFAAEFIVFYSVTAVGITGFDPYHVAMALISCIVLLALALLIPYKKTSGIA